MTEKPANNNNAALVRIGREIVAAVRDGFTCYRTALEATSEALLENIEAERRAREAEIETLRGEVSMLRTLLDHQRGRLQ